MTFEWAGNQLSDAGIRCEAGDIVADLMYAAPDTLGYSGIGSVVPRRWILTIFERCPWRIGNDRCLASVLILNPMPDPARREAEQIIEWAVAARAAAASEVYE